MNSLFHLLGEDSDFTYFKHVYSLALPLNFPLIFGRIMIKICIFLLEYIFWSIFCSWQICDSFVPEVEIAHHPLTCTSMQISIFLIDLTSEQSHQPKRIIMRGAMLMMSLSFSALRHPVNFDPRNSLQWYDGEKFN